MATKKDLVEAYSFSRRRLVTAFVSGAPGGREVEPTRPGRSVIGGVALAVLILAGAAVTGILKSPSTVDLSEQGLYTEKETGQPYIRVAEGQPLHPVANITSAQLLLGPKIVPTQVKRSELTETRPEATIGILGAPGTPPGTDSLLPSGWTACTGADGGTAGIKVDVTSTPPVEAEATKGFVVTSRGKRYLIAESTPEGRIDPRAYSYEIPQDAPDPILSALNVGNEGNEIEVPRDWLVLFTVGGALDLTSFGIEPSRLGKSTRSDDPLLPPDARVGDYVDALDTKYLVTDDKSIELDPFAAAVYLDLDFPGTFNPQPVPNGTDRPGSITGTRDLLGLNWPENTLEPLTSGELCARLDASPDQPPGARLASTVSGDASSAGIPFDGKEVNVEPGHGAVVLRGGWDTPGVAQPTLLDERGITYSMIGDASSRLGYAKVPDVVVPDQWLELFTPGVDLSVQAASCPPTSKPRAGPCGDGS